MLASILLSAALTASWAPSARFSLACTGTQTGYQEAGGPKLSLPWAETFTIDLTAGTWCSQGCAKAEPISAASASALDLDNVSTPDSSSLKRFQVSGGAYASAEVAGRTPDQRFHVEKRGT